MANRIKILHFKKLFQNRILPYAKIHTLQNQKISVKYT